jgi:hypothetical protein
VFPKERLVNTTILYKIAEALPNRTRDQIWKKMKSMGYVWDKDFREEVSENNPYPDHGKKWTEEEIGLFPENKTVNKEILEEVIAKLPRRKPSSIWPKMKKEGYIWEAEEEKPSLAMTKEGEVILAHTPEEKFAISLVYELGFRQPSRLSKQPTLQPYITPSSDHNSYAIAECFNLTPDFTAGELYYAIGTRITPFPWEMEPIEEVAAAYRNRDQASIKAAAQALHAKLERYLNG